MAKKYKYVYAVFLQTKFGLGMQQVKGDNKRQARERFRKRFKSRILSIDRLTSPTITEPI